MVLAWDRTRRRVRLSFTKIVCHNWVSLIIRSNRNRCCWSMAVETVSGALIHFHILRTYRATQGGRTSIRMHQCYRLEWDKEAP